MPFLHHLLAYHPGKRLLVVHDRGTQHQGAASRRSSVKRQAVSCSSRG